MLIIISNQFSLICNVSRWFSFLNEVSIEENHLEMLIIVLAAQTAHDISIAHD